MIALVAVLMLAVGFWWWLHRQATYRAAVAQAASIPTPVAELPPSGPGVYLLCDIAGSVLYVGRSVDMRRRVLEHIDEGAKRFALVSWLIIPNRAQMHDAEAILIDRFLPPLNRRRERRNGSVEIGY